MLVSGCSYLFLNRPPEVPPYPAASIRCTTSRAAPSMDIVLTAGFAALGLAAISANTTQSCSQSALGPCFSYTQEMRYGVSAIALGLGALALTSTIYGFDRTARCEQLIQWQKACDEGDRAACTALGAPDGLVIPPASR